MDNHDIYYRAKWPHYLELGWKYRINSMFWR